MTTHVLTCRCNDCRDERRQSAYESARTDLLADIGQPGALGEMTELGDDATADEICMLARAKALCLNDDFIAGGALLKKALEREFAKRLDDRIAQLKQRASDDFDDTREAAAA